LRKRIRFLREIELQVCWESFCRRTEETLTGESTHIFTKSQRHSSDLTGPSKSDAEVTQEGRTITQRLTISSFVSFWVVVEGF
jgi:hypothetical protein